VLVSPSIAGGFATVKATITHAGDSPPLSGRQPFPSKFGATALEHYKLSVSLAPLGCHETRAPALASDRPP
jgi:hypothetical protein